MSTIITETCSTLDSHLIQGEKMDINKYSLAVITNKFSIFTTHLIIFNP